MRMEKSPHRKVTVYIAMRKRERRIQYLGGVFLKAEESLCAVGGTDRRRCRLPSASPSAEFGLFMLKKQAKNRQNVFGPFSGHFPPLLASFCTKNSAFRAFSLWKSFDLV
jgi:hypothetical protein